MINQSPAQPDPIILFTNWFHEALKTEAEDADAACVASSDASGMPNARMVLVRKVDERGFTFFTNYESTKGREILSNPKAALCYHWKSLRRQVRIQGIVETVSDEEADGYYNSRARESRIGAWASMQSAPLDSRDTLLGRIKSFEEKFDGVENPPRPPYWSGFRIVPQRIEFWQQVEFRLHDRLVYLRDGEEWRTQFLYP